MEPMVKSKKEGILFINCFQILVGTANNFKGFKIKRLSLIKINREKKPTETRAKEMIVEKANNSNFGAIRLIKSEFKTIFKTKVREEEINVTLPYPLSLKTIAIVYPHVESNQEILIHLR